MRVVGPQGTNPTLRQALIRNIVRPFEGFGIIGVLAVVATDKGQRLGDLLASTFVVHGNELEELWEMNSDIAENLLPNSRELVTLTAAALQIAKHGIETAYNSAETGLSLCEDSKQPHGLAVHFDIIDATDDNWQWTTDGVTVSVPRNLADRCVGLMIDARENKLVVDKLT